MSDWKGTATPLTAGTDAYLTVAEADEYAALEFFGQEAAAWAALTEAQKLAALVQATEALDAIAWAGSKFDVSQARAFPRVIGGYIRDWDRDSGAEIVPAEVKRACFLEALSLASDPARAARLNDRHDGVASQSQGGVSESYTAIRPAPLCRRADALVKKWYLRGASLV
jgi:hypothetical protein